MNILIVDSLTETYSGSIVRSGLQKSALLDVKALSTQHTVTFAYCGHIIDTEYQWIHKVLSPIGTKDTAIKNGESSKLGYKYMDEVLKPLASIINDYDAIIVHVHTQTIVSSIDAMCSNKKIVVQLHDMVDLLWYGGMCKKMIGLRKSSMNEIAIMGNSQYTLDLAQILHTRNKGNYSTPVYTLPSNELFRGYFKHFVWTNITPEIVQPEGFSAIIGRFETNKYHHKVLKYSDDTHYIAHYGVKDPRRDPGFKYYDKIVASGNKVYEGLPDQELWDSIKTANSIILPCWHEGFGFTAFEAGIFGVIPIILQKNGNAHPETHATVEYFKRAGADHYMVPYTDENKLHDTINLTKSITIEQRKSISTALLNYFTLNNYIDERINLIESMEVKHKTYQLF